MSDLCEICLKLAAAEVRLNVVHEFKHSLLVVGDHQLFPGYCVLISKVHVREPFELPSPIQTAMFQDLMTSARAIHKAFSPWKMNYGCYGNQVAHVHWHLFPRYESDPKRKLTPWMQSHDFDGHRTTEDQAREVARRVNLALP